MEEFVKNGFALMGLIGFAVVIIAIAVCLGFAVGFVRKGVEVAKVSAELRKTHIEKEQAAADVAKARFQLMAENPADHGEEIQRLVSKAAKDHDW